MKRTTAFKVKSIRVNPRLAPDEFDLPFPAGIDVRDNRSDQFYLVRDDGLLQKIRNSGDSGPDTLAEASQGWSRRNLWVILSVAVSSLSLLAFVFARRRKRTVLDPVSPTQGVE